MAIFEIKKLSWLFLELCVKSWLFLNFSLYNSIRNYIIEVLCSQGEVYAGCKVLSLTKVQGVSRYEEVFSVSNLDLLRELRGYIYFSRSSDFAKPTIANYCQLLVIAVI
jgi:hypothetical protein